MFTFDESMFIIIHSHGTAAAAAIQLALQRRSWVSSWVH